jgi:HD-like signal output (HDOD) protein
VQKIQKLFAMENINSTLLVQILEQEPLLCANILKLVNSTHYGLSRKVTSISHAVMLLGTTIIRGIIMASVLKKSFTLDLSPYKMSIEDFDTICILRSRILTLWMKEERVDLATLSSAAFLMESGKIITANEIVKSRRTEEFQELLHTLSFTDAEKKIFAQTSYEIASKLFSQWLFETNFIDLIAGIEAPQTQEQKVLNVLTCFVNAQAIMNEKTVLHAMTLAQEYNLNTTKLAHAIQSIKEELA